MPYTLGVSVPSSRVNQFTVNPALCMSHVNRRWSAEVIGAPVTAGACASIRVAIVSVPYLCSDNSIFEWI